MRLFGLAMLRVLAAAWTELLQRQPIGIVALVLLRVIVALFAVGARESDEDAVGFLGHKCFRLPSMFKTPGRSPR